MATPLRYRDAAATSASSNAVNQYHWPLPAFRQSLARFPSGGDFT
jgi:hypothetical protein